MVCGTQITLNFVNAIKAIILWIKNLDMEYINGRMDGYTKETFKMIIEMDLDSYIKDKNACIKAIG
jgi:hypothetical protein